MIDLHLHSTNSDGSDTPEELVISGCQAGLTALSLTDHDTLDGTEEFVVYLASAGKCGEASDSGGTPEK